MKCATRPYLTGILATALLLVACGTAPDSAGTSTPSPTVLTVPQQPVPDGADPAAGAATPTEVLPDTSAMQASELLDFALYRRKIGDDETAAVGFADLLNRYADAPEARAARYYLAESFARRQRWSSAVAAFRDLADNPAQDSYDHLALFWLARSYEEVGDWGNAAAAYERYRSLNTPLEPYAALRQAAHRQQIGQTAEAAQDYEHVASTDINPAERAGSYERAIALRRELGQDHEALRLYDGLQQLASIPSYRARILMEGANLAEALGETETARAWLRAIVTDTPYTPQAVSAVQALQAAGDPALDPADAAGVYFHAEYYQQALPLFDTAISMAELDSEEQLNLRRLRALTLRALGDFSAAMSEFGVIANVSPDSEQGRQAELDWVQTLGQSGKQVEAAQRYQQFADAYPDDWRAPVALDRARQLHEWQGNGELAMQLRMELGRRYPESEPAPPALQVAAWHFYHSGRMGDAQQAWQYLSQSSEPYERARGGFWAGRIARSHQDTETARALFEVARAAAPNSYYGTRATEELGIPFEGAVPLDAPISAAEWQELEAWVAGWAAQPADGNTATLAAVEKSGFVQRAVALRQVGLHTEAIGEWNSARDAWADDATRLMFAARLAHEDGQSYSALKIAEDVAALAPQEALPPPLALERMIFPTPYAGLVAAEATAQSVDPRLFYALMRQESLFNPVATSWVGARGLAQVMPSTGAGIAQDLGVADFEVDHLYRPQVSVRFGTFYIGQRIRNMQGSIHGALAAYNAGLGNAQRWAGGSYVADADLFTESIDFFETEEYVKRVYGFYGAYRRIYALP